MNLTMDHVLDLDCAMTEANLSDRGRCLLASRASVRAFCETEMGGAFWVGFGAPTEGGCVGRVGGLHIHYTDPATGRMNGLLRFVVASADAEDAPMLGVWVKRPDEDGSFIETAVFRMDGEGRWGGMETIVAPRPEYLKKCIEAARKDVESMSLDDLRSVLR